MDIFNLTDLGEGRPSADVAQDISALLRYALNIVQAVEPASDEAGELVTWLAANRERFGLAGSLFIPKDSSRSKGMDSSIPPIGKQRWHAIGHALSERLRPPSEAVEQITQPVTEGEVNSLEAGLQAVSAALGFDELDAALFGIIVRYGIDNTLERLFDGLARVRGRMGALRLYPDLFALLAGAPHRKVNKRFGVHAPLVASGAILIDEDGDIHLPGRLLSLIFACGETGRDVRTELLGKPVKANLPWSSFHHLGREIEVARAVLAQALLANDGAEPERGVHILLYGPPGTGKTEFASSLAAELGVDLHAISEQSESRQEPSRAERLSGLLLAQRISGDSPALYLFDEAEDLFRSRGRDHESDPKIFVHRLLETARVPMIWAANDLNAFRPRYCAA